MKAIHLQTEYLTELLGQRIENFIQALDMTDYRAQTSGRRISP